MNWHERLADVGITLLLTLLSSGILIRLTRPALFDFIVYACTMRKAAFKKFIEDLFENEIKRRNAALDMVDEHRDVLALVLETQKQQTAQMPEIVRVMDRVGDAVERLSITCEKLTETQSDTQVALGRLEERSSMWERIHSMDLARIAEQGGIPQRMSDAMMQRP